MIGCYGNGETKLEKVHSNWMLIRRLLGLGWRYRWGCVRLLVLQSLLLLTALGALRLLGLGIDLIRWHVGAADQAPRLPVVLSALNATAQGEVAGIAGRRWGLEVGRGRLDVVYGGTGGGV